MRLQRGLVRLALGGCAGLLASEPAPAQLLIVEPPGGASVVQHVELAYAFGAGGAVTWVSLRAERGPLALVAALDADALCDEGLDAWFGALEEAASTRVLPPTGVSSICGQSLSPLLVAWPRAPGVAPQVVGLRQSEDVRALLEDQGLPLPTALPAAESYVVWSWPKLDGAFTTRTLRISSGGAPLELAPHASFPVLLSALTRGPMTFAGELASSELAVRLVVAKQQTHDYHEQAAAWLSEHDAPLLELRARGPIFDWSFYAGVSVPPLVLRYAQAAARELPELDGAACSQQLDALRAPRSAADLVACGAATDAGLALAAVDSEVATLERLLASSRSGVSWRDFAPGGELASPVLRARELDTSSCVSAPPQPTSVGPSPVSGGVTGSPGASDRDVEPQPTEAVIPPASRQGQGYCYDSRDPSSPHCDDFSCSCGPAPSSSEDETDCASDSSSSSASDSEADCASDSSSSSSSDSETDCASDSSSSSASDSETDCASDSSSSSSSSDGCSGDSSDEEDDGYEGYDGETCTGEAAPRKPQQAQAARPRRVRTSLWSLALAALVLPIRRRKRGLRAAG